LDSRRLCWTLSFTTTVRCRRPIYIVSGVILILRLLLLLSSIQLFRIKSNRNNRHIFSRSHQYSLDDTKPITCPLFRWLYSKSGTDLFTWKSTQFNELMALHVMNRYVASYSFFTTFDITYVYLYLCLSFAFNCQEFVYKQSFIIWNNYSFETVNLSLSSKI
jgi:hypothetical protein